MSAPAIPESLPAGWRLERFARLPSTADLLRSRAEAGEAAGLALLADAQSAGRGQHGRSWASPPGNLYLSVLLRPPVRLWPAPWSLLAAVALAEALEAAGAAAITLKWPNDVLLEGRKLAGILPEAAVGAGGMLAWLGMGFGVNLAHAPALPDRPTAALADITTAPAPMAFAPMLIARLARWQARAEAEGFAQVRAAWLARGPAPGAPMALRRGENVHQGAFAGLAEDGSLLLAEAGGVVAHAAGELAA